MLGFKSIFKAGRGELGTSLLETLIGTALIGMLIAIAGSYMRQTKLDEYESRARVAVDTQANLWLGAIERDLQYRELPKDKKDFDPLCTEFCRQFWIPRLPRKKADNSLGKYTSHYYSFCQDLPPRVKRKYSDKAASEGGDQFDFSANALTARYGAGHGHTCMAKANCPAGTYPQIVRTLYVSRDNPLIFLTDAQGLKVPIYPNDRTDADKAYRGVIPQIGDFNSTADRVVGAAICSGNSPNNSDRITMEIAFLSEDNVVRIKHQEVSQPRSNLARAQLIPSP